MKVSKQVNWIWQEWHDKSPEIRDQYVERPFYGKYQFTYSNKNGSVGVSEVNNMGINGKSVWQVLGLAGNVEDIQHILPTQEMAQETAYEMLGEKIDDKEI